MNNMYVTIAEVQDRMTSAIVASLCRGRDQTTYITNVIYRASDRIDTYAQKLYSVPLPDSNMVKDWCFSLVEYELFKMGPGDNIPQKYSDSYKNTLQELTLMQKGDIYPEGTLVRKDEQGISVDMTSNVSFLDEDSSARF